METACHTDTVRVQEAAELVAIHVYQRAEKIGQPITPAMAQRRVAELLAPRAGPAGVDCARPPGFTVDEQQGWTCLDTGRLTD